jgi:hypothetical protein
MSLAASQRQVQQRLTDDFIRPLGLIAPLTLCLLMNPGLSRKDVFLRLQKSGTFLKDLGETSRQWTVRDFPIDATIMWVQAY